MTYLARIKNFAAKWQRDEDGSVAVETVLMVPLLAWAMLATLTYFDAYRTEGISYKAGLTVADAISREADSIDDDYIDGAYGLLRFLTLKDGDPDLRVTVFKYRAGQDDYRRVWSKARGQTTALNHADLEAMRGRLPLMVGGERAILVETWTEYEAPYAVGLGDFTMSTYNVISPRFTARLCFDTTPADGGDTGLSC
ncbi:hypothetical protein SAMN04488515_0507 [Cognatiyoonia koreensis]|uniref:Flp pilus assembly protein TadG n=1 Tax=Cognatiyoonia koreensis TaxID=364200 RepID=A0A1I0NAX0_9RHOB|nr:hypothetical protein [Cognatiyoonia koreensis]SEV98243.1 hypothetical protein SAMN04488515_0507 [Cognatiyoonia koreensis]